ncbi:MAG TPA: glycosyltransferase family 39 protein [Thermoanaerobaculia bacterium]|jgi:hypothetical protein
MTRNERIAAWALAIFVAITRWPARSATLWDWDEALFALALRDYDVTAHHPHPPGFPLFIAAAKLIPLSGFDALQTVTFIASLLVFPAMFLLARELRATPFVAIAAALLLAFFPNVWFYGGTALSDVPSLVLVLAACALLLRGARSDASLLAGAVLLGVAAGFRPQNLLIGFAPFAIAFIQRRRTALFGACIAAAIVVTSFGLAAHFSGGWDAYRAALAQHESYIREHDSFLSPLRPWLPQVADDFFIRPYRAPLLNIAITLLATIGLVRRRSRLVVAIFGPFLLFAWLFLDFHSASRFSIGYMPLYALLAAEGIPSRGRTITLAALTALMIGWSWPALRIVHTTPSPPVAAIEMIRTQHRGALLFVDERLSAHAELLLPDFERRVVRVSPQLVLPPGAVLLREGASMAPGARSFTRERERLAGIARPRYFEVSVVPR